MAKRVLQPTGRDGQVSISPPPSDAQGAPTLAHIGTGRRETRRTPVYDFRAIESRWSARWEESGIYRPDLDRSERPYYNLMMFPYPSAAGLHVGNMYCYIGSDVHGRWMAMQGYDVFEPIGFDAFGIHSENYAIKRGVHPGVITSRNVEGFRRQLRSIGNRFDWSHEIATADPRYYHWTQWIFVRLFRAGLVERKTAPVNWCPNDKTVLADEQVISGRCERCGTVVVRRDLEQWFLKITHYADRLLENLTWLDWTERVKALQRNWIGRSHGLELMLSVVDSSETVTVFTTRPDTVYSVTFVALSPQFPGIHALASPSRASAVRAYCDESSETIGGDFAVDTDKPISGVYTGRYVVHPMTGERIPIWVSNYVLSDYGTGAVMGVPAHDERDLAFALAMGLPVRTSVRLAGHASSPGTGAFTGRGVLVDSGDFTGMDSDAAAEAISEWCESHGVGRRSIHYHLRDWLISRQRYWGPPIPIIYCREHGAVPVPEDQLPVLLPEVEAYKPQGTGASPLAAIESFVRTTCPICGQPARRETDVSDNFLDSAWYFLRFPSTDDDRQAWSPERTRRWLPPNMYIGGAEHSVLHLMYARFIAMALHDLGLVEFEEPFPHFRANGMITKDGAKISKSRGRTVNPDTYIERYGADVFRTYLLFMGPYEAGGDFTDAGIGGVVRFLNRLWQFVEGRAWENAPDVPTESRQVAMHAVVQQVTRDIGALKYNTAIAGLMKYLNELAAVADPSRAEVSALTRMLAPFAPFLGEELWERIGGSGSVHTQSWPEADEDALGRMRETIVVQVNGHVRDRIEVEANAPAQDVERLALATDRLRHFLERKSVRRTIYVPGRVLNFVTEDVE